MHTQTWGYCRACDHWFHCPRWFDKAAPQPVCAYCGSEPVAIENRSVSDHHTAARLPETAPI